MIKKANAIFLALVMLINLLLPSISAAVSDTLQSEKYNILEEKGYITRIIPETTVEEFCQKFNIESNRIHIYNGEEEITQGYIKTGMKATFEGFDEECEYELSVIGDINCDGLADQIDLNLLIKHVIGYIEGQIKGLEAISANLSGDGEINQVDITILIRYIMEHELYIPEIKRPSAPSIEIISGQEGENDWYTSAVTVKIKENETTPVPVAKTIYKVTGDASIEKEIHQQETLSLSEDGEYKITAYSYSEEGARTTVVTKTVEIDTTAPTNTAPTITEATNKLTATSRQTDALSGIKKVQYQIKKSSQTQWRELQDSNEFTGLEQNTQYDVRTYAVDKAGNAQYSEVCGITTGTIPTAEGNVVLTPSETNWTNKDVVVTATGNETTSGYTIQTKLNDGSWTNVANQTATAHGDVIYVRLTDGTNVGEETAITVNNIDKYKPTNTAPTAEATTNKIIVTNNQTDALSGIEKVEYQIKNSSETEWEELQDSNEFTGLEQNTEYDVRTYAVDKAGNAQYSEVYSITTGTVPTGEGIIVLTPSETNWTNEDVVVTSTGDETTTGYTIQTKLNNGSWTDEVSQTATAYGDVIYARLTDGTNVGAEAQITINNIDKDKPTKTAPTITETTNVITVINKQTDAISGIENIQYRIKKSSEEWGDFQSSNEFTGIEQNTEYDIQTHAVDRAGNEQDSDVYHTKTGKSENTTTVTPNTLTYDSNEQELVTVSDKQGTVYYSVGTELTESNYSTDGSTTIPTKKNAGEYVVYWFTPETDEYRKKNGNATVTIEKATATVSDLEVSTAGIVTWNTTNATGSKISIDGTTWTDATSGVNYLSTITETTGSRIIHVKAINSDTDNYNESAEATKEVTVVTLTILSNNTSYGTVSDESYKVISGATYETSSNKLTVKGITSGTTTTDLKEIIAAAEAGYTAAFSGWSSASGTISADTTVTANFTETANTYTIAYELNGGTSGTNTPTSGTYNTDVQISNPTREGYTFMGWTATGLGSNAKTGTAASPSTAWAGTSTKNTYFKNLTDTNGATVTFTANWMQNNYQNTSTSTYYEKLSDAMSAVASNQTIKVLNNKIETTAPTLESGRTGVTLVLNGKTVTLSGKTLTNSGTLTITGSGTLTTSSAGITNHGTLTMQSMNLNCNNSTSTVVYSTGRLEMTSVTISNWTSTSAYCVNMNSGTGTITSCTFNNLTSGGFLFRNGGTATFASNTLSSSKKVLTNASGATATVSSGTYKVSSDNVLYNLGTLTITGGTVQQTKTTNNYAVVNGEDPKAKLTIGATTSTSSTNPHIIRGISNYARDNGVDNGAYVRVYSGLVDGDGLYGISHNTYESGTSMFDYVSADCNVTIGNLKNSATAPTVKGKSGLFADKLTGGSLYVYSGLVQGTNGPGVKIGSSDHNAFITKLVVGDYNSGSSTSPTITGSTYGIWSNGLATDSTKINVYSGTITGTTNAAIRDVMRI